MSENKGTEGQQIHDIHEDHDGIIELDNALPSWWLNLFFITILFAAGYFAYYVIGDGPTLVQEYEKERSAQEFLLASSSTTVASASEPELRLLLKTPARNTAGQTIFQSKCVSCHGAHGEGGIGPNLTDDYWLHGGKMTDIVKTVSAGVLDRGMPPWGSLLKQDEIHSVVNYIKLLRGSKPVGAKAPQGELIQE